MNTNVKPQLPHGKQYGHLDGSLDVAQSGYSPQDPVVSGLTGPQRHSGHIGEVSALRLLIYRTCVYTGICHTGGIGRKYVHHWQHGEQDLGGALSQLTVPPVPTGSLQEEPMYVHPFLQETQQDPHKHVVTYESNTQVKADHLDKGVALYLLL